MKMTLEQMRKLGSGQTTPDEIMNENVGFTAGEEAMIDKVLNEQIGTIVAMEMAANTMEAVGMTDAINEAFGNLQGAFVDMGIINESITINTRRPKENHVILTKDSSIKRLQMLFALNAARSAKSRDFKRFKMATKIRKMAKESILARYGQRSLQMAKKAYAKAVSSPNFGMKTQSPTKK